jgi:nucleotide-binding universal stress UspA family protein
MLHLHRFEVMTPRGVTVETRRILVATDLGTASEEAIRAADAWAKLRGSEVLACHVRRHLERGGPPIPQRAGTAAPASDPLAEYRSAVRDQLRTVLGCRSVDVPVYIAGGEPGAGIAAVAEALHPDLVVVGAPRASRPKQLVLGSVAEDVVKLTRGAVLAVRPATGNGGILVAPDLSDDPLSALKAAAGLARTISGRVTVVHAVSARRELHADPIELASTPSPGWWNVLGEEVQLDASVLSAFLQRFGLEAEARIYREDAVAAVLETAEALRPELCVIAVGTSRCSTHGSLVDAVRTLINVGACSVLVVRPVRATA